MHDEAVSNAIYLGHQQSSVVITMGLWTNGLRFEWALGLCSTGCFKHITHFPWLAAWLSKTYDVERAIESQSSIHPFNAICQPSVSIYRTKTRCWNVWFHVRLSQSKWLLCWEDQHIWIWLVCIIRLLGVMNSCWIILPMLTAFIPSNISLKE